MSGAADPISNPANRRSIPVVALLTLICAIWIHPAVADDPPVTGAEHSPRVERIVEGIGPWNLALSAAAFAATLTALFLGASLLRQRRRMRALVRRIEQLEADEVRRGRDSAGGESPAPSPSTLTARLLGALRLSLLGRIEESQEEASTDAPGKAVAFVRANLSQSITVPQLAHAANVSARSLHRALQERFQCTPKELVTAIKMRAAMRLLRSGEWQVKDVAYQVGFANPYHFSRRFKEVFGVPPSSVLPD